MYCLTPLGADPDVYEAQQKVLLMDYNRAYYKWLFCPESEKEDAKGH
jgi:hypothetical protein